MNGDDLRWYIGFVLTLLFLTCPVWITILHFSIQKLGKEFRLAIWRGLSNRAPEERNVRRGLPNF